MSAVLQVQRVSRRFGKVHALEEVSLHVDAGETLALIGHNGAGKTTLFRLILGFITPCSGELQVAGYRPGVPEARRAVAYLPESVAFPKMLTGREIVTFYASLRNASNADALQALERVGLNDAMDRRCGEYSKGMRQRLGLAQALVASPRLLLLDEPTSGLDPASRQAIYQLLDEIAAAGTAVVMSSHGLNELEAHTRRVAMLSRGRLLAEGSVAQLLSEADLPLRILVSEGEARALTLLEAFDGKQRSDGRIEISCPIQEKMATVRALFSLDRSLADLEFRTPGLVDLYKHLADRDDRAVKDAP